MASNLKLSTAMRNALLDAITAFAGAGALLKLYTASQPANANTAVSGQTLLATLTCASTLAPAANAGTITFNAITSDLDADNSGTAAWFRLLKSDASTVVCDGSVGTSGADLNLNTTTIVQHATVEISSAVLTAPNA